jgi:hypothetical protein
LFARLERTVDSTTDALYGGATLIMRDVVRDFLRNEYSPRRVLSLQSRMGTPSDRAPLLEDLLPGALPDENDPALLELQSLAVRLRDEYFPHLTFRRKSSCLPKNSGFHWRTSAWSTPPMPKIGGLAYVSKLP